MKLKSIMRIAAGIGVSCCLVSCASSHHVMPTKPIVPDPVLTSINEAAQAIHGDLRQLALMKQQGSKSLQHLSAPAIPQSGPLSKRITMRWAGPLESATNRLAGMIGYHFQVAGHKPVQPILITVDAKEKTAFEVLEDIGWQAGERAGVSVNQMDRLIKVIYVGD